MIVKENDYTNLEGERGSAKQWSNKKKKIIIIERKEKTMQNRNIIFSFLIRLITSSAND